MAGSDGRRLWEQVERKLLAWERQMGGRLQRSRVEVGKSSPGNLDSLVDIRVLA